MDADQSCSRRVDFKRINTNLEKILGVLPRRGTICIDNPSHYSLWADEIFLNHIFQKLDINLSDYTSASLEEEVENWDRDHIVDLVENLEIFTTEEASKEKLRYLITRSMTPKGLARHLLNDETEYARYNQCVISELENDGINTEKWLSHGNNYKKFPIYGTNDFLEFVQWDRDFREDFAIGSLSNCCIAIESDKQLEFKKVLLDYFLDMSVQVLRIKRYDSKRDNYDEIGQVYFVALEDEKGKPTLGVTSVEIAERYRENFSLVPPIANAIVRDDGFRETYGFSSSLIGQRFSMFGKYLTSRRNEIGTFTSSVLKQKRANFNQEKDKLIKEGHHTGKIKRKLKSINGEIELMDDLRKRIYGISKHKVSKLGLDHCRGSFLGTNYLDLFGKGAGDHAGFFNPETPSHKVSAYHIVRDGLFSDIERNLIGLKEKYKKGK